MLTIGSHLITSICIVCVFAYLQGYFVCLVLYIVYVFNISCMRFLYSCVYTVQQALFDDFQISLLLECTCVFAGRPCGNMRVCVWARAPPAMLPFVSVYLCIQGHWPICLLSAAPGDSDGCLLTEYMALTIRFAVETSAASSSRLWVSLLTVSTLMSGLPRVTPRRPGRKAQPQVIIWVNVKRVIDLFIFLNKVKKQNKTTTFYSDLFCVCLTCLVHSLPCLFSLRWYWCIKQFGRLAASRGRKR